MTDASEKTTAGAVVEHGLLDVPTVTRGISGWRDEMLLRRAAAEFERHDLAPIRVTLPSGRSRVLGTGSTADAHLVLASYAALRRSLWRGTLGFAESYIDGSLRTPALASLIDYFLDNQSALERMGRGLFRVRLPDRLAHVLRRNTRRGSRRNIAAHYDLGNEFYRLWLDRGMTYSSALFATGSEPLEEAQAAKYATILDLLDIAPGQHLLEIGCGWGGMAEAAARADVHVTGVTISAEQLALARRRLAEAGLSERADLAFRDYRDIEGTYDRIVSIEMIEAVGEESWNRYFQVLSDRLAPGGMAVLQAITIREEDFAAYRAAPDFIQRYIFPGGMLPTVSHMRACAERAGLSFSCELSFGDSYVRTLDHWRQRFLDVWSEIRALGFDERFRRMWELYLVYCAIGFARGYIDVGLYRLHKPR